MTKSKDDKKPCPKNYRGKSGRKIRCKINHGNWKGTTFQQVPCEEAKGWFCVVEFMIVEAIPGTWLSLATRDLGWDAFYEKEKGYGAYERSIVIPYDQREAKGNYNWGPNRIYFDADRIYPGEVFLIRIAPEPPKSVHHFSEGFIEGKIQHKFQVRSFAGGGVGLGPVAGQVFSIEIRNPATGKNAMYTYSGIGTGAGGGLTTPSGWTDVELTPIKVGEEIPRNIDADSFEGPGTVVSFGLGASGTAFLFNDLGVKMIMDGWELQAGFEADILGYWNRIE
jgi:hypothetical protein